MRPAVKGEGGLAGQVRLLRSDVDRQAALRTVQVWSRAATATSLALGLIGCPRACFKWMHYAHTPPNHHDHHDITAITSVSANLIADYVSLAHSRQRGIMLP